MEGRKFVLSVFSHSISKQFLAVLVCAESPMGSTKNIFLSAILFGEPRVVLMGRKYLVSNVRLYLIEFQNSWCKKDKGIQERGNM